MITKILMFSLDLIMAEDSDSDFEDTFRPSQTNSQNNNLNAEQDGVSQGKVNKDGKTVRGKDIEWMDYERFESAEEYFSSDLANKLSEEFSCRRKNDWEYGSIEVHSCKFERRVGFLPCPWKIKINFMSTSSAVVAETTKDVSDHVHTEDPDYNP